MFLGHLQHVEQFLLTNCTPEIHEIKIPLFPNALEISCDLMFKIKTSDLNRT